MPRQTGGELELAYRGVLGHFFVYWSVFMLSLTRLYVLQLEFAWAYVCVKGMMLFL